MGKIGDQRRIYSATLKPQSSLTMDRFSNRPSSTASETPENSQTTSEQPELNTSTLFDNAPTPTSGLSTPLTAEVLDVKLRTLLQAITHNITQKVGKLAKELRGEVDQLEYKFDEMVHYVPVLEEDNAAIKNTNHSATGPTGGPRKPRTQTKSEI